jgi:hypothetical protein
MTLAYNAGKVRCFEKFKENLKSEGIDFDNLEKKEQNYLEKIHNDFHDDMKYKINEILYLKP